VIARQATRTVLLAVLACFLVALAAPAVALAAEFTVDTTSDGIDENLGNGICRSEVPEACTLRAAIEEINEKHEGSNTITFDPAVFEGEATGSILLFESLGDLPAIKFPTNIEAGTDCTDAGIEHAPCVGVVGFEKISVETTVFTIEADDSSISGISITGSNRGIVVADESTGFQATGNWIGISLIGTNSVPAALAGILLEAGSDKATIGGSTEADRNVIAFNDVGLEIQGASETTVRGNFFGVTGDGETPGPQKIDIRIIDSSAGGGHEAKDNEIGAVLSEAAQKSAECDGGCNVISGAEEGIRLFGANALDLPASGPTTIHGNYVGLDYAGDEAVRLEGPGGFEGNKEEGISVGSAKDATIGGDPKSEANYVVGGNTGISTEDSDGFEARGNRFGYSASGGQATPPSTRAIFLFMAGTSDPPVVTENQIQNGEGGETGIEHFEIGATITGNMIKGGGTGISSSGSVAAPNAGSLIEGNTIEDTEGAGILVSNAENEIVGNEVLRAGDTGIEVESETVEDDGNVIGGDLPEEENVVSDGGGFPIVISGAEGTRNEILGNRGSGNEGELGFFVLFVPNGEPNGVKEPTVESAGKTQASGKAEPGAVVRVFFKTSAEPGELGGEIGKTTADGSGNWTATYPAVPGETRITATQTKEGGTSRLSEPVKTPPDPPHVPVCPEAGATGCTPPPPPPDTTKPKVTIKSGPKAKSTSTTAKFKFSSNESGSTFKCKLDNKAFASCKSPKTYKKLKPGKHVFKVKATDAAGNVSSVVTKKFTVLP